MQADTVITPVTLPRTLLSQLTILSPTTRKQAKYIRSVQSSERSKDKFQAFKALAGRAGMPWFTQQGCEYPITNIS